MMPMRAVFALFFHLLLILPLSAQAASARVTELIITSGGVEHRFNVEMATTPKQQERGLMFRKEMAPDHGMLFLMPSERPMQMWMKNTELPLDMLFIDAKGEIHHIHTATPHSLDVIEYPTPVLAVLELLGGTAEKLGIKPGDRAISPAFKP